ncbi:MAG TPA: hypothetical protein VN893_01005 [Bryobacteraceae bacterium]|nr:hypothetical protein [Bryobacteraceae bacterium]
MLSAGIVVTDPEFRNRIVHGLQSLGVRVAFDKEDLTSLAHRELAVLPDLLVLDFSQPAMLAVMAGLKTAGAPVAVIAAHGLREPESILTAIRLGAREFLSPPLNEPVLAEVVRSIDSEKTEREARGRMARVAGFLAATGGCGASVIACHTAAELRRSGAGRIGLIDFDLASGVAGFWFGADGTYSVVDAMHNLSSMDASVWKTFVSSPHPQLDVLAAPAAIPLGALPGARSFTGVLSYARSQYDWVVADLGAQLTPVSLALAEELDSLFLVATPDVGSLLQARRIIQKLLQLNYPRERLRLLVSRVPQGQVVSAQDLKSMLGLPMEGAFPNNSLEIANAHASGRLMAPTSDFGRRIAQLSVRMSGRTAEETEAKPSRFSIFRLRAQEA